MTKRGPRLIVKTHATFRELVEKTLPLFSVPMSTEHAGTRPGAAGASFENIIAVSNKAYERMNLGIVKKNQVKAMVVDGVFTRTEKATVDYDGYLVDVGFVAFDAKTAVGDCWRPDRRYLHQFLYLLRGSRSMPKRQARFFYLIELRQADDRSGILRTRSKVYLVEDLESVVEAGKYAPRHEDEVMPGVGGVLFDYRAKLIATVSP